MAERLFVGIPLPESVTERLAGDLQRRFPAGLPGRSVPPANWHLTLRFLGNVDASAAARLRSELGAGGLGRPFELRLDRLGAFPSARRARVVWLGTEQTDGPVFQLAAAVERRARMVGFPPETRAFSPHLTLARLRDPGDLRTMLASIDMPVVNLTVEEIAVFRSHLGGPVPLYEVVESFPLLGTGTNLSTGPS